MTNKQIKKFRAQILAWYDANYRPMPWRAPPGKRPEPYHEWLSEIMLQQTTVAAVIPYFLKFVKKWPDIHALAGARQEEVMVAWAGLGYYARARNLHACAKMVSQDLGGVFPDNEADLMKLPGIGPYTAAAIAAIAFGRPAVVVDGNVERVMARYFAVAEPLPGAKPTLKKLATPFYEGFEIRPGDFAQGMMEMGATVCVPSAPRCPACPVQAQCKGRILGIAKDLPAKTKAARPRKYGHVYWITDGKGRVLLHRRPQKGLLGGMAGLPTSDWLVNKCTASPPAPLARLKTEDFRGAKIRHVFSHFELELKLRAGTSSGFKSRDYFWVQASEAESHGLPTVFRKALKIYMS